MKKILTFCLIEVINIALFSSVIYYINHKKNTIAEENSNLKVKLYNYAINEENMKTEFNDLKVKSKQEVANAKREEEQWRKLYEKECKEKDEMAFASAANAGFASKIPILIENYEMKLEKVRQEPVVAYNEAMKLYKEKKYEEAEDVLEAFFIEWKYMEKEKKFAQLYEAVEKKLHR